MAAICRLVTTDPIICISKIPKGIEVALKKYLLTKEQIYLPWGYLCVKNTFPNTHGNTISRLGS